MLFNQDGPQNPANKAFCVFVKSRVWSIHAVVQNTWFLIIETEFRVGEQKKNKNLKSMKLANPKKEFATCLEIIASKVGVRKSKWKKKKVIMWIQKYWQLPQDKKYE